MNSKNVNFYLKTPIPSSQVLVTSVASHVLLAVRPLLELLLANIAREFSVRIVDARHARASNVTLRLHEVRVRLLVSGEVRVGEKAFVTHLAIVRPLP